MNIRCKSFVPRSKKDHTFDNVLQASSSVSQPSYVFSVEKSTHKNVNQTFTPKSLSPLNSKSVNVITLTNSETYEQASLSSEPKDIPINSSNSTLLSVIHTNRTSSIINHTQSDSNRTLINSVSKTISTKRKVVKEVREKTSLKESKKRYISSSINKAALKTAVSSEILRPEILEQNSEKLKVQRETFRALQSQEEITSSAFHVQNGVDSHKDFRKPIFSSIDKAQTPPNDAIKKFHQIIRSKKSKALYNPRPWQECFDDTDGTRDRHCRLKSENVIYLSNNHSNKCSKETNSYSFDQDDTDILRNPLKSRNQGVHNLNQKCRSVDKKNVILHNVKEAHECQERGEAQDLLDDVDYLMDGLKTGLSPGTRALSVLTLTTKCMDRPFRDLMRAHGLLTKALKCLDDAHLDQSLAMSTAALFLVFCRDKQPMIFDDSTLTLLLKLPMISKNQIKISKENERVRDKIRLILHRFHQGPNDLEYLDSRTKVTSSQTCCSCCRHLKLDNNITTEDLVVECLLQFSSKKCPDWFKSLLRRHRGLDLICDQVISSVEYLGSDLGPQCLDEFVMDRLLRLFNYMRFFEHMTFQNRDIQSYLVDYDEAVLVETLVRCLKLCAANLSFQSPGTHQKKVIQLCLMANLRLLANISHDNDYTCNLLGNCPGLLKLIFSCLLHLPRFMSSGKRFDLSVLALALLINLVEHCSENRRRMAHVSISRKRVACLGKCGQVNKHHEPKSTQEDVKDSSLHACNMFSKNMVFSFDDEVDEEDMDVDDDEEKGNSNEYMDVDCESSELKINILEALVKLFLRHDDRAKNNTLIEGEEMNDLEEEGHEGKEDEDPKWRMISKGGTQGRMRRMNESEEEEEEEAEEEEGPDVEFVISSKEDKDELQRKLSAAGQHMQDSVVSAYVALLLGCIMKTSGYYMERIRDHLPLGRFKVLAFVLAKFLSIVSLTSDIGHSGEQSILDIVRLLESQDVGRTSSDKQPSESLSKDLCPTLSQYGDGLDEYVDDEMDDLSRVLS